MRLDEECDVVGHDMKWNAESSMRIFLIGEGLFVLMGYKQIGERDLQRELVSWNPIKPSVLQALSTHTMSRQLRSPSNQHQASPPPPMAHKVWILDCKNCHMFLTNRGMKVTHSNYILSFLAENVDLGGPPPAT